MANSYFKFVLIIFAPVWAELLAEVVKPFMFDWFELKPIGLLLRLIFDDTVIDLFGFCVWLFWPFESLKKFNEFELKTVEDLSPFLFVDKVLFLKRVGLTSSESAAVPPHLCELQGSH